MIPDTPSPDNCAELRRSGRTVYDGRIVRLEVDRVVLPGGPETTREVVRHRGAVALLAETDDGRILLVRQYRYPIAARLLEIPAGTLEPGERPEACARREMVEETGCRVVELAPLGEYLPAPGYSDEVVHLFHARVTPTLDGPAPDDDERIEVVPCTVGELRQAAADGRIRDGKTLAAICRWMLRNPADGRMDDAT